MQSFQLEIFMLNFRFRYIKVENIWKLTVLSKIENSWWLRKLATKSTCLYIKSASFHDFLSPVVETLVKVNQLTWSLISNTVQTWIKLEINQLNLNAAIEIQKVFVSSIFIALFEWCEQTSWFGLIPENLDALLQWTHLFENFRLFLPVTTNYLEDIIYAHSI